MKLGPCLLLLALDIAAPEPRFFRYNRPVLATPPLASQACLTLDAETFAHAAPRLADLRLYRDTTETPYVVTLPSPVQADTTSISLLNLGLQGKQVTFDAAMPQGTYTDLHLGLTAKDFIATVQVSGSNLQAPGSSTSLGAYNVFDLTQQKLGRSTVLHLPESNFRYLHFAITGPILPADLTALTVERLPTSHPMFQPVAQTSQLLQKPHATVVELTVPAHVPVDRLIINPASTPALFSREVRIAVEPLPSRPATDEADLPPQPTTFTGNLLRLHTTEDGHRIDEERLAIDTPWVGSDAPSRWTITIENGDDAPLDIASISLQMVERDLCFDAFPNAGYTLFYGDRSLTMPKYDYSALFRPQTDAAHAAVGPEQRNPTFESRPDPRPFTEKHPALLWAALLAVIAVLGVVALRSSSRNRDSERSQGRGE